MCTADATNRTAVVVGLIAMAAGIATVSYLYWWRARGVPTGPASREVPDILAECYAKVRDIQRQVSELPVAAPPASVG